MSPYRTAVFSARIRSNNLAVCGPILFGPVHHSVREGASIEMRLVALVPVFSLREHRFSSTTRTVRGYPRPL